MLYNPNWKPKSNKWQFWRSYPKWLHKPGVDPFSLEGFALWLEAQDPTIVYDYSDPMECAWAQYMKAIGYQRISWDSDDFPKGIRYTLNHNDQTYGAALARAKKLLEQ